jgi:hypothetical protein
MHGQVLGEINIDFQAEMALYGVQKWTYGWIWVLQASRIPHQNSPDFPSKRAFFTGDWRMLNVDENVHFSRTAPPKKV